MSPLYLDSGLCADDTMVHENDMTSVNGFTIGLTFSAPFHLSNCKKKILGPKKNSILINFVIYIVERDGWDKNLTFICEMRTGSVAEQH